MQRGSYAMCCCRKCKEHFNQMDLLYDTIRIWYFKLEDVVVPLQSRLRSLKIVFTPNRRWMYFSVTIHFPCSPCFHLNAVFALVYTQKENRCHFNLFNNVYSFHLWPCLVGSPCDNVIYCKYLETARCCKFKLGAAGLFKKIKCFLNA